MPTARQRPARPQARAGKACTRCRKRSARPGRRLCVRCARGALDSRLRWIAKRRRLGGCLDCRRKAVKGSDRCAIHEWTLREYQRRSRQRRRQRAASARPGGRS
jgi:hypothetical protein